MKKIILLVSIFVLAAWGTPVPAAQSQHDGHDGQKTTTAETAAKEFQYEAVTEGIRAKFEIMTLAGMNVKDPEGATHHIMIKLFRDGSEEPLSEAVGRVKIIDPEKQEVVTILKDYGDIFAANFTVDKTGKYGIICLLKADGKKLLYKFWYHNM